MPGTNDPAADDLESVLATQATETTADPSGTDGTQSDPVLDALKPQGHVAGKETPPQPQPPQDWEKRYKSLRSEYDKRAQKQNSLEALLKNPQIAALAKSDPTLAQALAKAGLQAASDEAKAAGDKGMDDDDAYWQTPEGRMELYEAKLDLKMELRDFGQEQLGRRLKPEEETQIRRVINKAGALTVAEAWTLTPAGRSHRLEQEQKRLAEAQAKLPPGRRPRPTPAGMGGSQKLDMTKPVTEMNEQERREYLRKFQE